MTSRRTQAQRGEDFRALHEGEPFLIPNPWDAGTAGMLAGLGFKALATTSSGLAHTLGRVDGEVSLDQVAAHIELLTATVDLPLSADLEDGLGPDPEDAAAAIRRVAEAGAVGGSIEDYDPRREQLYELSEAVERVIAAREAVDSLGFPFTFTARSEGGFRGDLDIDDTLARLQAYEAAGADVVYAPGLHNMDAVRAIREGTTKPLNVIARPQFKFAELAGAGAQRVSVGGSLARVASQAATDAARSIIDSGDFSVLRMPSA